MYKSKEMEHHDTPGKLKKSQSEEKKITSKFLGENLAVKNKRDLKLSRSLSPKGIFFHRFTHSLSSLLSTSACSLTTSEKQGRPNSLLKLRSLSGSTQSVSAPSSSTPSSPVQWRFLGQIYRHSLEQRATTKK